MVRRFKSFMKTVGGNEGSKCHYPTRLDTYGCGCQHDCRYCYAKSLLDFRKLCDPDAPAVADVRDIDRTVERWAKSNPGEVVRLGGMTDCFQPCELQHKVTLATLRVLRAYNVPYLIVTKGGLVAYDEYLEALEPSLAHVQVTITTTDARVSARLEKATAPEGRMWAVGRLVDAGIDTAIRLSPFLPGLVDLKRLADVRADKMIVEFLRVNGWTRKWLGGYVDLSPYTVKHGGYSHMPLDAKVAWVEKIRRETGKVVSVCDDEDAAYRYWRDHVNPNPDDCCNITFKKG